MISGHPRIVTVMHDNGRHSETAGFISHLKRWNAFHLHLGLL